MCDLPAPDATKVLQGSSQQLKTHVSAGRLEHGDLRWWTDRYQVSLVQGRGEVWKVVEQDQGGGLDSGGVQNQWLQCMLNFKALPMLQPTARITGYHWCRSFLTHCSCRGLP